MKKSIQKNRKRHVTIPNAGIKEKVISHCPPDMTASVKEALEQEIEDFDAVQARKDIEEGARGRAAVDAYLDWLEHNEGHELPEANPDILADNEGIQYFASHKDDETVRLLKEFRQLLTAREVQVWNLVMQHQYSFLATAKLLRISESSMRIYLKRAKEKFTKYMEAIKRVEENRRNRA